MYLTLENQGFAAQRPTLTRTHYTALRAWLQGLSVELIACRYLGYNDEENPVPDKRLVLQQLQGLRDELIQRALQHGKEDLANALQRDIRNNAKGVHQAIDAVNALQNLGSPRPALNHAVELWFAPALAKRLRSAKLASIEQLIDFCNDYGHNWYRRAPRIGIKAASVIVNWLNSHGRALGKSVGAHVTRQLTLPALQGLRMPVLIDGTTRAVPPLEAIRLPVYCDGSTGENRGDKHRCALEARNDYEAILTFLSLWPEESPTRRAYRKEAERFLAWAVIERAKSISSLKTEDCIAYRDFLANPQPKERWCGPMVSRSLPGWRPFQGPLSPSSQKYAITVLKRLCEFLTRKHYLHINPWLDVPQLQQVQVRIQIEKALPYDLWEQFSAWLDADAPEPKAAQHRLARAAIYLIRDTGIRLSEACRVNRAALMPLDDPESEVWGELRVLGKRNKLRDVPISRRAIEALEAHWRDHGEDFQREAAAPLLKPLKMLQTKRAKDKADRAQEGYSSSGLHTVIKSAAERFAATLSPEEKALAQKAIKTRAHALRHTFGTHAASDDVPVDVLQTIFGHESMTTTTIYTRPERKRRLKEIGRLYSKTGKKK